MKWTSRTLPGGLGVSSRATATCERTAQDHSTTPDTAAVTKRSRGQALPSSPTVTVSASRVNAQNGHVAKQTASRSATMTESTLARQSTDSVMMSCTQAHTREVDAAMAHSESESTTVDAVQHTRVSKKPRIDVADGRAAHKEPGSEEAPSLQLRRSVSPTRRTTANRTAAASSSVEAMRAKAVKKLRSALHRDCSKHGVRPPLLCVERWLFRNAPPAESAEVSSVSFTSAPAAWDPVLPSLVGADHALIRDLVRAGLQSDAAEGVAKRISELALVEVASLSKATPCRTDVTVRVARGEVRFSLGMATRPYVRCNTTCYEKLCDLWHTTRAAKASCAASEVCEHTGSDRVKCEDKDDDKIMLAATCAAPESSDRDACMNHDIYCLLTRYDTIAGEGYQAALPALPFGVLQRRLGVTCECFASPLNSTLSRCVSISS